MFLDVTWLEIPKLFISSTMDENTKTDRESIIEDLKKENYDIIEFQCYNFPYDNMQDLSIVDETINAVNKANVFILILDNNYGTVIDNKSIIHQEYERAKELKLPIFVFIKQNVWRDFENKKINSKSTIKKKEYYDFILELSQYKITPFKKYQDCVNYIKEQFLNLLGGVLKFSSQSQWLWNENTTRRIEKSAKEIWIITPDFLWDFDDKEFHAIVMNNVIDRDCKYKYIYKNSENNNLKRNEMLRLYKMYFNKKGKNILDLNNQVQFLPVNSSDFNWSTEQILFNPFSVNEMAIAVDIMDVRDRTLKFNIEFGLNKRIGFRKQFIDFWNSNINNKNNKIDISNYNV